MNDMTQRDEVLRPPDVQRDYRIKVKTLLKHRDEIPHFTVGSRTLFRRSAIEAWIAAQEAQASAGGEAR
jgi:hypothetical protein